MEGGLTMAAQWGNNSLAPGASAGWFFARTAPAGFLPIISVKPLTPSFTNSASFGGGTNYPFFNQLGVSTIWSQLSNDGSTTFYFLVVINNSNNTVSYAFVEADL
jgi:hypothetical protein